MFLANLVFIFFTFKNMPSPQFKYLESSDVIIVKKKSLLAFAICMF